MLAAVLPGPAGVLVQANSWRAQNASHWVQAEVLSAPVSRHEVRERPRPVTRAAEQLVASAIAKRAAPELWLVRAGGERSPVTLAEYEGFVRLQNELPVYPRASRARGDEGRVVLRVRLEAGSSLPSAVELDESSGHELLDRAALETVRRWEFPSFETASTGVTLVLPFRFELSE